MKFKIGFILIGVLLIIYSCKSQNIENNENYIQGIDDNYIRKKFFKDSLNLIAPIIQLRYENDNHEIYSISKDVKIINEMTTTILKIELNKTKIHKTELNSYNKKEKNRVLEKVIHEKSLHPNWIMKAPSQILIPNEKYTLLVEIYGIYGNRNMGQISFAIINNIKETIEIVDKEKFSFNPKNKELMRELISKGISRLIDN
nr:hypothetical protein [uncultured Psychroserpens sp.]